MSSRHRRWFDSIKHFSKESGHYKKTKEIIVGRYAGAKAVYANRRWGQVRFLSGDKKVNDWLSGYKIACQRPFITITHDDKSVSRYDFSLIVSLIEYF